MKAHTQQTHLKQHSRAFVLAERWILSAAMRVLASVLERRLVRAIKRTA